MMRKLVVIGVAGVLGAALVEAGRDGPRQTLEEILEEHGNYLRDGARRLDDISVPKAAPPADDEPYLSETGGVPDVSDADSDGPTEWTPDKVGSFFGQRPQYADQHWTAPERGAAPPPTRQGATAEGLINAFAKLRTKDATRDVGHALAAPQRDESWTGAIVEMGHAKQELKAIHHEFAALTRDPAHNLPEDPVLRKLYHDINERQTPITRPEIEALDKSAAGNKLTYHLTSRGQIDFTKRQTDVGLLNVASTTAAGDPLYSQTNVYARAASAARYAPQYRGLGVFYVSPRMLNLGKLSTGGVVSLNDIFTSSQKMLVGTRLPNYGRYTFSAERPIALIIKSDKHRYTGLINQHPSEALEELVHLNRESDRFEILDARADFDHRSFSTAAITLEALALPKH